MYTIATVITFGQQKGGASKTTTSAVTALLLSYDYRVLCCDMDSQANLTEIVTLEDPNEAFENRTILEAMKERDARPYIRQLTDNVSILPADEYLATFPSYIYEQVAKGDRATTLGDALAPVQEDFDFIVIDTPPALGDLTVNALSASDYVVVMFEPSKFCYNALPRFLELCAEVQESANQKLDVAGILPTLIDSRRADAKDFIELVQEEYGELVFPTVIRRKAATGRLPIEGLFENKEIVDGVSPYTTFVEELVKRVNE